MELYVGNYFNGVAEKNVNSGENFAVEELLDFSNVEDTMMTEMSVNPSDCSTDSTTTFVESSISSSGDLCVPVSPISFPGGSSWGQHEEVVAELEWLSNFVEESYAVDQLHMNPIFPPLSSPTTAPEPSSSSSSSCGRVPAGKSKARSKRSRAAAGDWSTRVLRAERESGGGGGVRKCVHCATEKTPQWRTGPMGPKTLCNACGVRFKSGRLVPEYRPASSPTFVSSVHSNSHRKVLELRRQKELFMQTHHHIHSSHASPHFF